MNMSKKQKIFIIAGVSLVFAAVCWVIFAHGFLNVQTTPTNATVKIGKTIYEEGDKAKINLPAWFTHLIVTADYYTPQNHYLWVTPWVTKKVDYTMQITTEGQSLLDQTTMVTDAWIAYTKNKDSGAFLSTIKNWVSSDTYNSLDINIAEATTSGRPDVHYSVPSVSGPVRTSTLTNTGEDAASLTVYVTKKNDSDSVSSLAYDLKKENGSWLIENITYSY